MSVETYGPAGHIHGVLEQAADVPLPQLQETPAASKPARVLVLEDDELQLQVLSRHLETLGLQVVAVNSMAAAQKVLQEQPLQLAILDIHLPDGSGLQLCEQIDADAGLAGLPTIVLSSLANDDLVRQTRAAGGYFFIGKPYDPNVLLAVIERALGTDLQ